MSQEENIAVEETEAEVQPETAAPEAEPEKTPEEVTPPEEEKKKKSKKAPSAKEKELQSQLDEQKELYLRLRAEYDNFRKRSQKEKEDNHNVDRADVIKSILPVIDNFERAVSSTPATVEDSQKGIEMIFNQFNEIFAKLGVETFGEAGVEFDPNLHNAVMHIEDESLGENVIAQVFQKGYRLGNTVIRFATVQVAN